MFQIFSRIHKHHHWQLWLFLVLSLVCLCCTLYLLDFEFQLWHLSYLQSHFLQYQCNLLLHHLFGVRIYTLLLLVQPLLYLFLFLLFGLVLICTLCHFQLWLFLVSIQVCWCCTLYLLDFEFQLWHLSYLQSHFLQYLYSLLLRHLFVTHTHK